jgi:hypothetical protein
VLGPSGGTVCLEDQGVLGRAVCYSPGTYRTVLSAVILGALDGSQRGALLGGLSDYLGLTTGVAEPRVLPAAERVTLSPNPVKVGGRVRLTLPRGFTGQVQVFDAAGRTVSFDIRNSSFVTLPAGSYVLRAAGQSVPFAVVR